MINKIKSYVRDKIKSTLLIFFRSNELLRKRVVVGLYNLNNYYLQKKKVNKEEDWISTESILSSKRFKVNEYYLGNHYYGIADNIKRYTLKNNPIKACIEHGVYFGDYVNEKEGSDSGLPAVITFSDQRKKHLRVKTEKPVFTIGPYIYYADSYYSKEFIDSFKKKNGKTLLVFPVHSIDRVHSDFDINTLINKINEYKIDYKYNTVIVCLYWKDIELGRATRYINEGFVVTTAGYREDPNFLGRLKSIIEISDYTLSNSVGTHIGYCVLLGKPHTIIRQKTSYKGWLDKDVNNEGFLKKSSTFEKSEVEEEFLDYSPFVTDSQKKICSKYWGLDEVKSKEELNLIIDICEEIYQKSKGKESSYKKVTESLLLDNSFSKEKKEFLKRSLL